MSEIESVRHHWNYFLALEKDLEVVSRYVEFSEANFSVYSIELAHLLFAAASEVDVVSKLLCRKLEPDSQIKNIEDYRAILCNRIPALPEEPVTVNRYDLKFTPWESWSRGVNPEWWRAYNDVKHERNEHFSKATLRNALEALGALLILIFYLTRESLTSPCTGLPQEVTLTLNPPSSLLRLNQAYYWRQVIV